jgi:phosphate transport system protein
MAVDLRFITSAMKIVTDLERMGDQAVNIAERAISLNQDPQLKPYIDLPRMAEIAQSMVKDVLDAFVTRNSKLARSVCERDDLVDGLNDQVFRELLTYMMSDPKNTPRAVHLMIVSRCLERIADHATNIAEDVIFMVDALVIKHHADAKEKEA